LVFAAKSLGEIFKQVSTCEWVQVPGFPILKSLFSDVSAAWGARNEIAAETTFNDVLADLILTILFLPFAVLLSAF
jgi:hypothetical protein